MRGEERHYVQMGDWKEYYQEEPIRKRKIIKAAFRSLSSSRTHFGFNIFTKQRFAKLGRRGTKL